MTAARRGWLVVISLTALAWPGAAQGPGASPISVRDLIGLTLFGSDPHNGGDEEDAVTRSPDGAHVAVLLQRGNLERNTVDYALLVLRTADLIAGQERPDTLIALASATNDPAIQRVRWLADNRTLVFLGRRAGEPAQVYGVDIATRGLSARTHSTTGITTFEIAAAGEPLLYQEQQGTVDTSDYAAMRAHGYVIKRGAWLSDVLGGDFLSRKWDAQRPAPYRVLRGGTSTELPLPDSSANYTGCRVDPGRYGPPLSLRGDAVLFVCRPTPAPAAWNAYRNPRFRREVDVHHDSGDVFVVVDLASRKARPVAAGPVTEETSFQWAPDGRSLIITNALLPLTGPDSARRVSERMTADVPLDGRALTVVVPHDTLVAVNWDATGTVEFAVTDWAWWALNKASALERVYYRKTARGWSRVAAPSTPRVRLDEGPNTPPRLVVVTPGNAPRVVFDPSREFFATHRVPRVELLHWNSAGGNAWVGGLYYPLDYVPGRRYPVVLQTHGYDSTRYDPEGAFTTDQAALPLASEGMFVLQTAQQTAGDLSNGMDTPAEGPFDQHLFEAAIDTLDHRGLIDRTKVAMQGFSRTCFATLYFLTHSSYPVAAANLADGVDFSYGQYLAYFHVVASVTESMNGGRPWGAAHAQWLERAPGFRLDRVSTALRLTAIGPWSVISEWEPFAALSVQGKPVELVYLPLGTHILVKPWERLTSQQGAVDWYRFWLQGYEDPDPAKAEQYGRWRTLRAARDSTALTSSR